jgi:hypothetical protein
MAYYKNRFNSQIPVFRPTSNDIKDFPFQDYAELNQPHQFQELATEHRLSSLGSWMLPQILAHYGSWQLVECGDRKIDPKLTAKRNITSDWHVGLWRVATQVKRSSLVAKQNTEAGANYSALVPLVLAGVKRHQNVNYSRWDLTQDSKLVEPMLLEAMFYKPPELNREELLELRERGLEYMTGAKIGQKRQPQSAWCLSHTANTKLHDAPALATTMLAQIWVAHPQLRTNLMVLDPQSWDLMPEPLLATEVLNISNPTRKVHVPKVWDLPWN